MAKTGFDTIAEHLIAKGVSVSKTGGNGHYSPNDIVGAISKIGPGLVPYVSKNCGVKWTYSQGNKLQLTVGNYTNLSGSSNRSGTIYVDMNGNIS